jgi:hypothetical protein
MMRSMSFAVVHSRALDALDAQAVTVEVHLANGLPSFTLLGLADTEGKESPERWHKAALHSHTTSASPSTWRWPTCRRNPAASTC